MYGEKVHVVNHPLLLHKLTILRDKGTATRVSGSWSVRSACC